MSASADATAAAPPNVERVFLGWDAPALPRAAERLWVRFGPDFRDAEGLEAGAEPREVLVAVPGRRAGRRLEELLVERAEAAGAADWRPPRIEAVGEATDALVRFRQPRAGSLVRELTWLQVVQSAGPQALAALVTSTPDREDVAGWIALAELVRGLHGEVAAEGMEFAEVVQRDVFPEGTREAERWQALAALQKDYRKRLAKARLDDPHLGRLDALKEARLRDDCTVVLLGTAGMNPLQRRILERAAARGCAVHAWVVAPEDAEAGFDALGTVAPGYWADAELPVPADAWTIAERPDDQATEVVRALTRLAGGRPADEVVVATPAPEVIAPLRRALDAAGAGLRSPVGRELRHAGPWRLLDRLAAFLPGKDPEVYAELLRHPDLAAAATRKGFEDVALAPAAFDDYRVEHLPRAVDGDWLGKRDDGADAEARRVRGMKACESILDLLQSCCGDTLWADRRSPLPETAAALRALLESLYAERSFDRRDESDRLATATLERLVEALDECDRLPEETAAVQVTPSALLRLLLRRIRTTTATPAPARERDIEQLGWLDLPLDDAPVAVAAGLQHGLVPSDVHAHAFLPDVLRTRLGMSDQAARTARDVYALRTVWETRKADGGAHFLAGRQSPDGDPWLPSALYFRCAPEELAARTRAAFPEDEAAPASAAGTRAPYRAPTRGTWRKPEAFSASSLRTYFQSPYAYFLKYVLGLDEPEAPEPELGALQFGNLIHDVLEDFAQDAERCTWTDPEPLGAWLARRLQELARTRFGQRRPATLELQLQHAERRLWHFAEIQAAEADAGWRVVHSEWSPRDEGGRKSREPFTVTADRRQLTLRGRIDRVERNERSGAWRVLDYKSGEQPMSAPAKVWSKNACTWKDVQLPLYRCIVREHLPAAREALEAGQLQLGYFSLPKAGERAGIWTGNAKDGVPFTDELLDAAEAQVMDAVEAIRAAVDKQDEGFFREAGDPSDGMVAVLAGTSYLAGADDEGEEEDA